MGAIDGVHFKMKCPSSKAVKDPVRYKVTRKDIYALVIWQGPPLDHV